MSDDRKKDASEKVSRRARRRAARAKRTAASTHRAPARHAADAAPAPRPAGSVRWPAVILIPALLAGMWLLDADDDDAEPVVAASHALGPLIASDDSLGAFWFCAGGTGTPDGFASHSITILNTTDQPRFATVTVYGSRPDGGERPVPVPIQTQVLPYARVDIPLGDHMQTVFVSATVEVDGGGVLVEHGITSPTGGLDRAPCATAASEQVTIPAGSTNTGPTDVNRTSAEILVFFNPYPADAVVDVTFSTSEGVRDPEDFMGFVVPGRGVVGVDLAAADVTLSEDVATEIVARTGRVVVDRIQVYNEADPPRVGLALSGGVAEAAEAWTFAVGGQDANTRERLVVYNPGDVASEVDVEIRPDESGTAAANEPFELTIQPHRHEVLDLATEERMQELLATPTPYSLVVRSADGTRITAERMRWGTPGTPGGGVGTSTGSALAARRLVADMSGAQAGSTLVLLNPSTDTIARVTLAVIDGNGGGDGAAGVLHEPVGPAEIELAPGARRAIPLEQLGAGRFAVVVESDVPIVGERDVVIGAERFTAIAVADAASAVVAQLSLFSDDLGG